MGVVLLIRSINSYSQPSRTIAKILIVIVDLFQSKRYFKSMDN